MGDVEAVAGALRHDVIDGEPVAIQVLERA